jgi:O-antigen ligase
MDLVVRDKETRLRNGRAGTLATTASTAGFYDRLSNRLDRTIAGGLLGAVVFTALAHGAVEPWATAIFELMVLAMVFAWGVKAALDQKVSIKIPPATLPLAALVAVALAQSVALTDATGTVKSLSMDVEASRGAVTMTLLLLVASLLAANFLSTHKRLQWLVHFLVGFGFALAVFGIVQNLTWNGRFYWLRPNSSGASPFGPFVNHNNFSGYMEMLIPLPIGLAITGAVRKEARLFYLFAASVMCVALVAALSRGGVISLAAGLLMLAVLGPISGRPKVQPEKKIKSRHAKTTISFNGRRVSLAKVVVAGVLLAAAITAAAIWMGSDRLSGAATGPGGRASGGAAEDARHETFFTSRGWIWRDAVSMIRANPLTGVGIGAFATAYPSYGLNDGSLRVDRAHNDYLEILADCGIVGGVIALWFILSIGRAVARGIASHDRLLAGFALGGGASIFSLLVHSIFDFNLQLPSNALLFLVIAAETSLIGAGLIKAKKRIAPRLKVPASRDELADGSSFGSYGNEEHLQQLPQ